uniref:Uncharacterized protein n=1 Tax=Rhizophora mucronata TaxID=61149 RepID=A0A2P2ITW0_RHIMU
MLFFIHNSQDLHAFDGSFRKKTCLFFFRNRFHCRRIVGFECVTCGCRWGCGYFFVRSVLML